MRRRALIATSEALASILPPGDFLAAVAPPWAAGSYEQFELLYDDGSLWWVKTAVANSNAAPSTYNSGQYFERLTRPDAFVGATIENGELIYTRANGVKLSLQLPAGASGGGAAEPIRDVYAVEATLRGAVVGLSYTNRISASAPAGSVHSMRFVHETTGIIYECMPIPGAETVTRWVKNRD